MTSLLGRSPDTIPRSAAKVSGCRPRDATTRSVSRGWRDARRIQRATQSAPSPRRRLSAVVGLRTAFGDGRGRRARRQDRERHSLPHDGIRRAGGVADEERARRRHRRDGEPERPGAEHGSREGEGAETPSKDVERPERVEDARLVRRARRQRGAAIEARDEGLPVAGRREVDLPRGVEDHLDALGVHVEAPHVGAEPHAFGARPRRPEPAGAVKEGVDSVGADHPRRFRARRIVGRPGTGGDVRRLGRRVEEERVEEIAAHDHARARPGSPPRRSPRAARRSAGLARDAPGTRDPSPREPTTPCGRRPSPQAFGRGCRAFSRRSTRMPRRPSSRAAMEPATLPPTTTTSGFTSRAPASPRRTRDPGRRGVPSLPADGRAAITSPRMKSTEALERFPTRAREPRVNRSAPSSQPKVSRYESMMRRPPGWNMKRVTSERPSPAERSTHSTTGLRRVFTRSTTSFERTQAHAVGREVPPHDVARPVEELRARRFDPGPVPAHLVASEQDRGGAVAEERGSDDVRRDSWRRG